MSTSSTTISPDLLRNITAAVIKQLCVPPVTPSPVVSTAPTIDQNLISRIANSVARSNVSVSPAGFSTTLSADTQSSDSTISRTWSGASSSSNSSAAFDNVEFSTSQLQPVVQPVRPPQKRKSCTRELNFAKLEKQHDNVPIKRRKKKPTCPYTAVVTRPVLERIDKELLAPEHSPTLFRRKFKKQPNPDGTRELKLKADIVMKEFKRVVRPVLRMLLGRIRTPMTEEEQQQLYTKYYQAAFRVVKKRRANHVQSWRLYGESMPLKYDSPTNNILAARQTTQHTPPQPAQSQQPAQPPQPAQPRQSRQPAQPQQPSQPPQSQQPSQPLQVQQPSQPQQSARNQESARTQFTCPTCKNEFPIAKAFPNETIQLGACSKQSKKLFKNWCFLDKSKQCEVCWKKHMLENVIPLITNQRERDFWIATLSGQKIVSKKKQRCKWCKSTTHKTNRSKKCPFNKNNVVAATAAAVDAAVSTAAASHAAATADAPAGVTVADADVDVDNDSSPKVVATSRETNDVVVNEDLTPKFQVGDNVYCKWKRKQWYLAHVTAVNPTDYDVYFPGDGKTKTGVPFSNVREEDSVVKAYRRGELIGKTFYCDGDVDLAAGEWKVRKINEGNTYMCTRITGGGRNAKNCEEFDIGYVIREIVCHEQTLREN